MLEHETARLGHGVGQRPRSPRPGGGARYGPARSGPRHRRGRRRARTPGATAPASPSSAAPPLPQPPDPPRTAARPGGAPRPGATSARSDIGTAPGGRIRRALTTWRPAALLAAATTRICSRRAFVAHADDSGHTVSRPESASKPTATTCPASSGAMAAHRSRRVAPAAGSSQAHSVTSAPIAAPRPIGSRPSRRTVVPVRGFLFAFWPLPFFRACSIAARSATRARSTPDTSPSLTPAPRWCARGPGSACPKGAALRRPAGC